MVSTRSPEYQQLLRKLKAARKRKKMTQVEVGRLLDKPRSYIAKTESGERRIDPIELLEFADLYDKSISYFLSG